MKNILRLAPVGLLLAVFATPVFATVPASAVLTVKYKGEMRPVVKVIGSDPVVMFNGHDKRIRTKTRYQPQTGGEFSAQKLEIVSASFDGTQSLEIPKYSVAVMRKTGDTQGGGGSSSYNQPEINLTLKAPQTLKGAFIVIGVRAPYDHEDVFAKIDDDKRLVVRALPTLSAGTATSITITDRNLTFPWTEPDLSILVFDAQGHQIMTNADNPS